MPRPRVHAPESVLDAAEELLVAHGRAGLTVRALAERAGFSNGSIYHAFGTLEGVVAGAWLRRAEEFLALQRSAVDEELGRGDPRRAVQAAADAPARLAERDLRAARLLVALDRDDLLTESVADPVAGRLRALDAALLDTLRALARAARGRADAATVDVLTTCVVRLPTALLFPGVRAGRVSPSARRQLAAAVAAVLDCD
jgi:AcrR family transcriptional regulator